MKLPPAPAGLPRVDECLLCASRRVTVTGLFEHPEPWRYHPAPLTAGKIRLIGYGLCRRCAPKDETDALRVAMAAEEELLRRMEALKP